MKSKTLRKIIKLFVLISLVLTTTACGSNDRYDKYMKKVKNKAKVNKHLNIFIAV